MNMSEEKVLDNMNPVFAAKRLANMVCFFIAGVVAVSKDGYVTGTARFRFW